MPPTCPHTNTDSMPAQPDIGVGADFWCKDCGESLPIPDYLTDDSDREYEAARDENQGD